MNIARDFEKLLAEGIAKGAFDDKQIKDLESTLFEYESLLKSVQMLSVYMSHLIKMKEYQEAS